MNHRMYLPPCIFSAFISVVEESRRPNFRTSEARLRLTKANKRGLDRNLKEIIMISFYVTVVGTKTPMMEITDLLSVLKSIRDGAFSEQLDAYREALESGNPVARDLKIALPAFKPSGVFTGLTDDSLQSYSQFVHLDYDHLSDDEMIIVRDTLSVDKYVFGFFISTSLRGYKVFFKTNAAHSEHMSAWAQVRLYMDSKLGIESDPSVKNIGRNVFVSDDPDTFINQEAKVFIIEHNQIEEYHFRTQTS